MASAGNRGPGYCRAVLLLCLQSSISEDSQLTAVFRGACLAAHTLNVILTLGWWTLHLLLCVKWWLSPSLFLSASCGHSFVHLRYFLWLITRNAAFQLPTTTLVTHNLCNLTTHPHLPEFLLWFTLSLGNSAFALELVTGQSFLDKWVLASDNRLYLVLNGREGSRDSVLTAVAQGMLLSPSEAFLSLPAPPFSFQKSKTMPPIRDSQWAEAMSAVLQSLGTLFCGSYWFMIKRCKAIPFTWLVILS